MFIKLRYGVENRQARARGTFAVVVMGLGIAEECHHAVTKILRYIPSEALYSLGRRAMVLADDFAPLFRVQMASYFGRADEIAEKHRQMAPLAG